MVTIHQLLFDVILGLTSFEKSDFGFHHDLSGSDFSTFGSCIILCQIKSSRCLNTF